VSDGEVSRAWCAGLCAAWWIVTRVCPVMQVIEAQSAQSWSPAITARAIADSPMAPATHGLPFPVEPFLPPADSCVLGQNLAQDTRCLAVRNRVMSPRSLR
jgi:hypothetical protein